MEERKLFAPSPKKVADKTKTPEETIVEVEEAFRRSGLRVFRELRRIDKGRLGIPVYISIYDLDGQKTTGNYKQMGKGATDELSRASALMELVERFSLFSFVKGRARERLSTLAELGEGTLSVEELLESVDDPEKDSRVHDLLRRVLPEVPFHMVPALDVAERRPVQIPFYWFWILYEYNGSAAGNTYAEAAVQATCELIERHVSALSHRLRAPMPEIRRESISGEGDRLCRCFERLGIRLWIRDMTYGMPVPTVAAMAMDPSTFPERSEIVYASGTGTSPERALIRTLTEIAQLAGDFDTDGRYLESALPKFADLEEASYVTDKSGELDLSDLPNIFASDHTVELETLARELRERGYRLFMVDIGHPDLNLPAVYAIIPGALFRERTRISPLYHLVRTVALYLPGNKALPIIRTLLEEVRDRYYLWGYYGKLLAEEGNAQEALRALEKALSCGPDPADRPALMAHLAEVNLRLERYAEARKAAEEGLAITDIPELWNLLGRACFKLRDYTDALAAFLRAVELEPSSAVDYANAGYCLRELGAPSEARRFFEMALSLDPTLKMAREGLEWCESRTREEGSHV
ncbi:YcaO-like family protein [Thermosulfurimonas sp. F29]|uniref:YcaO-like family protein n=1 Tax=Thermosulfurimonas sp. F29 TaxID=2867247 RepID=UPI001C83E15B|nr:YcaO-like family protein [Thermosulfurimonas sp. F29]MBX6423829.1 YcaO-like family protein [Thermosulfurimonas sp. F29]